MIAAERLALRREEDGHIVRLDGELRTRLVRCTFRSHATARSPMGT